MVGVVVGVDVVLPPYGERDVARSGRLRRPPLLGAYYVKLLDAVGHAARVARRDVLDRPLELHRLNLRAEPLDQTNVRPSGPFAGGILGPAFYFSVVLPQAPHRVGRYARVGAAAVFDDVEDPRWTLGRTRGLIDARHSSRL